MSNRAPSSGLIGGWAYVKRARERRPSYIPRGIPDSKWLILYRPDIVSSRSYLRRSLRFFDGGHLSGVPGRVYILCGIIGYGALPPDKPSRGLRTGSYGLILRFWWSGWLGRGSIYNSGRYTGELGVNHTRSTDSPYGTDSHPASAGYD
ncbi:hypothetical protein N7486_003161 [Penicillium sp. IBT 16267x]|nr:hypothetical protein N7486_003161 [Penicillium sp. IBT 16267x]